MVYVGLIAFALAFLALIIGTITAIVGLTRKKIELSPFTFNTAVATFALHTIAVLALVLLQITEDYSVAYVVDVINPAMPMILKITALWGAMAGSLFFWSWVLHLVMLTALVNKKKLIDNWSFLVISVTNLFFAAITLFIENPFAQIWELADGNIVAHLLSPEAGAVATRVSGIGLNPLLRHPGMIIHPPLLYIGFALFLVPFAVAVSQLIRKTKDDSLLDQTRSWIIGAWVFLTAGLALGSWWSYGVLGWGGYWAWDPVETASLLPWLTGTALLHSLLLERHRGIFRRFNLTLVLSSWFLVVFSIFVTRSGMISSVHAFGESGISGMLMVFTIALFVLCLGLLIWRWKSLATHWEFKSAFDREALFLYTNVILIAIVVACLWGLLFPLINSAITGVQMSLDPSFFQNVTAPLFILLVLLLAICPLVGWSVASLKRLGKLAWIPLIVAVLLTASTSLMGFTKLWSFVGVFIVTLGLSVLIMLTVRDAFATKTGFGKLVWKQRARYGAYLVHAGVLLIALGITGVQTLSSEVEAHFAQGDRMPFGQYEVVFDEITETFENPEYLTAKAQLTIYKNDVEVVKLFPAQHIYSERNQTLSIPSMQSTARGDLYTNLIAYTSDADGDFAVVNVIDNPLVNWMWVGAMLMVLGGLLALSLTPKPSKRLEGAPELLAGQETESEN
ncbi:MAG: cytochrome c-type biogenesis CcmF C-terminal domain-containing protein [Anaerolineaceae bacterium]